VLLCYLIAPLSAVQGVVVQNSLLQCSALHYTTVQKEGKETIHLMHHTNDRLSTLSNAESSSASQTVRVGMVRVGTERTYLHAIHSRLL
jgi:hypothetical protein